MRKLFAGSKRLLRVLAQILLLVALSQVGTLSAERLDLAMPGNMIGMVALFTLLSANVVRLEWVESAASLLLKHLAFFFVPIAVGLMGFGELIRTNGAVLLLILAASAAAGILVAGKVAQGISRQLPAD